MEAAKFSLCTPWVSDVEARKMPKPTKTVPWIRPNDQTLQTPMSPYKAGTRPLLANPGSHAHLSDLANLKTGPVYAIDPNSSYARDDVSWLALQAARKRKRRSMSEDASFRLETRNDDVQAEPRGRRSQRGNSQLPAAKVYEVEDLSQAPTEVPSENGLDEEARALKRRETIFEELWETLTPSNLNRPPSPTGLDPMGREIPRAPSPSVRCNDIPDRLSDSEKDTIQLSKEGFNLLLYKCPLDETLIDPQTNQTTDLVYDTDIGRGLGNGKFRRTVEEMTLKDGGAVLQYEGLVQFMIEQKGEEWYANQIKKEE